MFAWTKVLAAVVIGSALLAAPVAIEAKNPTTLTKIHTGSKSKTKVHHLRGHKNHTLSKSKSLKPSALHSKHTTRKSLKSIKSSHKSLASSKKASLKSASAGWKHHPAA